VQSSAFIAVGCSDGQGILEIFRTDEALIKLATWQGDADIIGVGADLRIVDFDNQIFILSKFQNATKTTPTMLKVIEVLNNEKKQLVEVFDGPVIDFEF